MAHKLLLADDSITIQRVIELTFAEEDVNVLAVGDGKHAIDRIQTERPDIVLADVGMPEQDGYEVAAFVKGNPQLAHIPVLLLTGAFEPIDEHRARTVGCDGVLVKPFEPQMVINRVKDLLAGKKPAGSNNATPEQPRPASGQESYVPRATNQGDSLEDYFDRLDAAFATLSNDPAPAAPHPAVAPLAPQASAPAASAVDVATWDPDLTADVNQPAVRAPIPLVQETPPIPVVQPPIPLVQGPTPVPAVQEPPPGLQVAPAVEPGPLAKPAAVPHARAPIPSPPSPPAVTQPAPVSLAEAFATLLAAEHGQAMAPIPLRQHAAAMAPDVVENVVRQVLDRLHQDDMRRAVLDVAERLVREEIDRIKRTHG
jgi:CheY-like chemotaxis protein